MKQLQKYYKVARITIRVKEGEKKMGKYLKCNGRQRKYSTFVNKSK